MVFKKKGQAALEFLTTYGWAFLIILVMIGALAYFGVLDPSNFAAERCVANTPLACDGQNFIATNETISVRLRNGLNEDLNLSELRYRTGSADWVNCTTLGSNNNWAVVNGTRTGTLTCALNTTSTGGTTSLVIGARERIEIGFQQCAYRTTNCTLFATSGEIQLYTNIQSP